MNIKEMKRALLIIMQLTALALGAYASPALDQAKERLQQAREQGDSPDVYDAWIQVVNAYIDDSRNIFAMEELQHMLDYASSRNDYYGMSQVYTKYGELYVNNYSEAFKNLDLALEYANMSGRTDVEPYIYCVMAKSALNDDRDDDVLALTAHLAQADGIYPTLAHYLNMMAYSQKGEAAKAADEYAAIESYWEHPSELGAHERDVVTAMLKYLISNGRSAEALEHASALDNSYALAKQEVEAAHYLTTGNLKSAAESLGQLAEMRGDVIASQQKARMQSVNEYLIARKLEERQHGAEVTGARRGMWICIALVIVLAAALVWALLRIRKLKEHNALLTQDWEEMEAARQEAVRLSQMKSSFIDNMSHELRTPLNSIMGFTEILNNPEFRPTEEKRNGMLQHIHTQSAMLLHLLDNVVMLSRIDANDLVPNIERLHLSEIVEDVCEPLYKDVADGVTFNVERGILSGIDIFSDREIVTAITRAVLENAVKFTQRGSIDFDCATDQAGNLIMTVTDTGDGIPAADVERIYDRFEKLGRIEQGFGLGLSCARELLDMLGGTITLDTSYSHGARFVITIPNQQP